MVRNVANLAPPFEEAPGFHGVSAAIEFAVVQLKVETILVLGHAQCGGVAAALWLVHLLASIALGEATASARRRTGAALLAVVVLMTATLTAGRRAGARRPSIDRSTASEVTETRPAPPALH